MARFAIVIGEAPDFESALGAAAPHRLSLPGAKLFAWTSGADPAPIKLGGVGYLIGDLFRRSGAGSCPVAAVSDGEAAALAEAGAARLTTNYWGNYVALLATGRGIEVLRAPCGELPCYWRRAGEATLLFSDIADVVDLRGLDWRLDRRRVAAALVDPRVTARATALVGVNELLGGERLTVVSGAGPRIDTLWTAAAAARVRGPSTEATAAAAMRDAVLGAVGAWSARHQHLGLLLSGGLDSSLLLGAFEKVAPGCLTAALHHHLPDDPDASRPTGTAALTAAVGSADEHAFADAAARHVGLPLTIVPRVVAPLDMASLAGAPLSPWPTGFAYRLDVARTEAAFAHAHGLSALVSGHAGDQVLFNGLTPLTAADHLRVLGWRGFSRRLDEAALRSGLPIPQVLALAIRHGLLRRRPPRPARFADSGSYVTEEARAWVGEADLATPWEDELAALPPAKALHARYVATCLAFAGAQPAPGVAIVNPLHAQGVVETCLSIPTPVLTTGGVGRGLARAAFGDLLAPAIAKRRTKAGGAGFIQALVELNAPAIRDYLRGGIAAGEGFLDRHSIDAGLGPGGLRGAVEAVQVLDYLAVESWLRAWQARGAAIAG